MLYLYLIDGIYTITDYRISQKYYCDYSLQRDFKKEDFLLFVENYDVKNFDFSIENCDLLLMINNK